MPQGTSGSDPVARNRRMPVPAIPQAQGFVDAMGCQLCEQGTTLINTATVERLRRTVNLRNLQWHHGRTAVPIKSVLKNNAVPSANMCRWKQVSRGLNRTFLHDPCP